ncbi:MAG: chemotaxis protein CheA [Anaerolineales bacterium]|nr:chemotaxis protein CheA [Anaerolineales bacterium]MBP6208556.1 chemotaxis protein CheA [Anaerolineales bacterium]MBP8164168.1 chemotaxis protein CheA [Anaerolineales bacterium]
MEIIFDINEEELPIFLAEVDEHLQALDDSLIRLESGEADPELVQIVFRAAHTIKGMSGMIGHQRMTDLTHAMETVLDGVRKNTIQINSRLINVCLDAVDHLRMLRNEVSESQTCDVDMNDIVIALKDLIGADEKAPAAGQVSNQQQAAVDSSANLKVDAPKGTFHVRAKIDIKSMASAARAFQLMMALQDVGEIQEMKPTQAEIESSTAIEDFSAVVRSEQDFEEIRSALMRISGVNEIYINGKSVLADEAEASVPEPQAEQAESPAATPAAGKQSAWAKDISGERRAHNPFGRRNTDMTIRMNVERLDNLVNLVGELITDRNHLKQIHSRLTRMNSNYDKISETILHLGRITDELQEEVMHIRMLPLSSVFGKFPRMVHDMSRKVGKKIDIVIRGEKTEMDRSMLEEINDPLIHLVRNSVDHGVESPSDRLAAGKPERGTITLTARHEQGRIILTVEDDGGGINAAKLRASAVEKGMITPEEAALLTEEQSVDLMFMAGLSTAQKVTDISGRGVGLDIVNNNIQRINGSISVETHLGRGTSFIITLPLTLAIVPSLLVKVRQTTFAIPLVMITETFLLKKSEIKYVYQKPVTMLRESVLSLVKISEVFSLPKIEAGTQDTFAVVVQSGKQRIGLVVDELVGEEDVVVKPLGAFIGDIPGISSAAILGEGQVALIVDVFGLFKLAGI